MRWAVWRAGLVWAALASQAAAQVAHKTPEQLFDEAIAAHQRGDDATAIEDYRAVLKVAPGSMETHANLGALLAANKRFPEAIREYEAALKIAPDNRAVQLDLSLAYYKQDQWARASEFLAPLNHGDPSDVRVAVLLADCDIHLDKSAQAVVILTPLEAANPDNLDVASAMASALLKAQHLQEALLRLDKVADGTHSAQAYLRAGQTALLLNLFEAAKRDADDAEAIDPNFPGVQTLKGQALQYLLDNANAIAALRKAVQQNPDDFDAQVTLGSLLNGERDGGALEHLRRAVELKPSSTLAHYELGRAEQSSGDLQQAVRELESVTSAQPDWLPPHVALAAVYGRLKRIADAKREREIVDRLTAEEQKKENSGLALPSH